MNMTTNMTKNQIKVQIELDVISQCINELYAEIAVCEDKETVDVLIKTVDELDKAYLALLDLLV